MHPLVIGLDFGTSGVKGAVYDAAGTIVAATVRDYPTRLEAGGVVEQAPDDWWRAAEQAIRAIVASAAGRGAVRAIGLSGQIGTIVPLASDAVLWPGRVPTWQDLRSSDAMERIERDLPRATRAAWLGIDLPPGPNWPLPRLAWWMAADPAGWARVRRILQPKDYIGLRLTGEMISDASSWRGLVHLPDGRAVSEVLDYLGLAEEVLPPRADPGASRGRIRRDVAESLGLDPEVEVAVGWNDLNCAALGAALEAGEGFDLAGTSDHLGVVTAAPPPPVDGRLTAASFRPGTALVYGVTATSGGALEWFSTTLLAEAPASPGWKATVARAATTPAGSEGLLFLPHLAGERAPLWDPKARGAFVGLSRSHRREHFLRAVLEGVAFHLESIRVLLPACGRPGYFKAAGRPTGLALWNQIRADVFGVPLWIADDPDLGARGAAMLAAPLAGIDPGRLVPGWRVVAPDQERHRQYADLYPVFRDAYPQLQGLFHRLGDIAAAPWERGGRPWTHRER